MGNLNYYYAEDHRFSFFLVGSGQRSIVAAKSGSQSVTAITCWRAFWACEMGM